MTDPPKRIGRPPKQSTDTPKPVRKPRQPSTVVKRETSEPKRIGRPPKIAVVTSKRFEYDLIEIDFTLSAPIVRQQLRGLGDCGWQFMRQVDTGRVVGNSQRLPLFLFMREKS